MGNKVLSIFLQAIPVLIMIGLIPFVANDYYLAGIFILVIVVSFFVKREKSDFLVFVFGVVIMTVFEYIFISTGVEVFERDSLFGVMPIWLPVLWGYGFVAIKRCVRILD